MNISIYIFINNTLKRQVKTPSGIKMIGIKVFAFLQVDKWFVVDCVPRAALRAAQVRALASLKTTEASENRSNNAL